MPPERALPSHRPLSRARNSFCWTLGCLRALHAAFLAVWRRRAAGRHHRCLRCRTEPNYARSNILPEIADAEARAPPSSAAGWAQVTCAAQDVVADEDRIQEMDLVAARPAASRAPAPSHSPTSATHPSWLI